MTKKLRGELIGALPGFCAADASVQASRARVVVCVVVLCPPFCVFALPSPPSFSSSSRASVRAGPACVRVGGPYGWTPGQGRPRARKRGAVVARAHAAGDARSCARRSFPPRAPCSSIPPWGRRPRRARGSTRLSPTRRAARCRASTSRPSTSSCSRRAARPSSTRCSRCDTTTTTGALCLLGVDGAFLSCGGWDGLRWLGCHSIARWWWCLLVSDEDRGARQRFSRCAAVCEKTRWPLEMRAARVGRRSRRRVGSWCGEEQIISPLLMSMTIQLTLTIHC